MILIILHVISYQFNRAKQLHFSCKLNKLLNNLGCKGLNPPLHMHQSIQKVLPSGYPEKGE